MILHTYFFSNKCVFWWIWTKQTNIYIHNFNVKEKGVEGRRIHIYRSTFLNKKESIQINTTKFNTKCLQNQLFKTRNYKCNAYLSFPQDVHQLLVEIGN